MIGRGARTKVKMMMLASTRHVPAPYCSSKRYTFCFARFLWPPLGHVSRLNAYDHAQDFFSFGNWKAFARGISNLTKLY